MSARSRVPLVVAKGRRTGPEHEAAALTLFAWKNSKRGRFPWSKLEKPWGIGIVELRLDVLEVGGRWRVLWDPSGLLSLRLSMADRESLASALSFLEEAIVASPESLTKSVEFSYSRIRASRRELELTGIPDPRIISWVASEVGEHEGLPGGALPPSLSERRARDTFRALREMAGDLRRDVELIKRYRAKLEALISSVRSLEESEKSAVSRAYAARLAEAEVHLSGDELALRRSQLNSERQERISEIESKYGRLLDALENLSQELEEELKSRELMISLSERAGEVQPASVPMGIVLFGRGKRQRLEMLAPCELTEPGLGTKLRRVFGGRPIPLEPRGWGEAVVARVREAADERSMIHSGLVTIVERKNLLRSPNFVELSGAGLLKFAEWGYLPDEWVGEALAVVVGEGE